VRYQRHPSALRAPHLHAPLDLVNPRLFCCWGNNVFVDPSETPAMTFADDIQTGGNAHYTLSYFPGWAS
jgi:hypothetical protein